jgi:hypothetical protein
MILLLTVRSIHPSLPHPSQYLSHNWFESTYSYRSPSPPTHFLPHPILFLLSSFSSPSPSWLYCHFHRTDELKKGGSLVYGVDEDDEENGPGQNLMANITD